MAHPPPPDPASRDSLAVTTDLLQRAKSGDRAALEALIARYLPRLNSWASGRLPMRARSLLDTGDLVNETLLRTLERLDAVEVRGPGGFQAYVRSAVLNRIRDQIRWTDRRLEAGAADEIVADPGPTPLDLAIGADLAGRYERALATLAQGEQQLVHLRIELDFDYEEIAAMTDRPTAAAARMATTRALRRLAEVMKHER
jgi:RNA polymerase sigma-70 factor, ECF subfamily